MEARLIEEACAVGKMVTDFQRGQGLSYVEQRLRPGPLVAPRWPAIYGRMS